MDSYGFLWIPMDSYGFLWIPMDSGGIVKVSAIIQSAYSAFARAATCFIEAKDICQSKMRSALFVSATYLNCQCRSGLGHGLGHGLQQGLGHGLGHGLQY
jgi:hypothetical protein